MIFADFKTLVFFDPFGITWGKRKHYIIADMTIFTLERSRRVS